MLENIFTRAKQNMSTLALQRGRSHVLLTRMSIMRKQKKSIKINKEVIFEVNYLECVGNHILLPNKTLRVM